jgi:CRISPR-associated protein Cmr1
MEQLDLTLEIITPLFMDGATQRDPDVAPELRPASVRGAARYWLRAALGGILGDGDLANLADAESRVFGNAGTASPVSITISPKTEVTPRPYEKKPTIRGQTRSKPHGQDYLFWSLARNNQQEARNYIPPRAQFDLMLMTRGQAEPDATSSVQFGAQAALWLLSQLGGLGSRARRAAGSFVLRTAENVEGLPPFATTASDAKAHALFLAQGIQQIRKALQTRLNLSAGSVAQPSAFDVLHPGSCKSWVVTGQNGTAWRSSEDALAGIGGAFRDFRSETAPRENVAAWIESRRQPQTIARAVFGLPLPFRYADGGPSDVLQGSQHDRRASPLHLRVAALTNGQHVGVATLFKAHFLEKGEQMQLQRTKQKTSPPGNYDLIEQFITHSFAAQEVGFA